VRELVRVVLRTMTDKPIASRALGVPGGKIIATVGPLRRTRRAGRVAYECGFRIVGRGLEETGYQVGEDSMQALMLAIQTLGRLLSRMKPEPAWLGTFGPEVLPLASRGKRQKSGIPIARAADQRRLLERLKASTQKPPGTKR
jgi:hypothetical protein